jgi:hypothetical protein
MAAVSFIEQEDQADVIEPILKHCQLWDENPARAPPCVAFSHTFTLAPYLSAASTFAGKVRNPLASGLWQAKSRSP